MARHKEFDPDEALQKARGRFHRHGFAQSSMQDLLGDMNIGQGSCYATFGSKKELFERALESYADEAIGNMVRMLRAGDEPLHALEGLLAKLAGMWCADPAHRGCLLVNTVVELAPHDPELAESLRKRWERLELAVAEALTLARERGDIAADKKPRELARFVVAVIHGMAVRSKYDPRPDMLHAIARTALAAIR